MVESAKKLRKRKEHDEGEGESLIGSVNQAEKKKKRRLEPPDASEDGQAREDRKRGRQERKEAHAEKRSLKGLKRNRNAEGCDGQPGSSEGLSGRSQALTTNDSTDRQPTDDVTRRKNNQKRATPPGQPIPVPSLADVSENGPASQTPLKSKQRHPSKAGAENSQDLLLAIETRNAEASSSSASRNVAASKKESKEAKQKKIESMGHEEVLSSVWLNAAQLREKVEMEGAFHLSPDCVTERLKACCHIQAWSLKPGPSRQRRRRRFRNSCRNIKRCASSNSFMIRRKADGLAKHLDATFDRATTS